MMIGCVCGGKGRMMKGSFCFDSENFHCLTRNTTQENVGGDGSPVSSHILVEKCAGWIIFFCPFSTGTKTKNALEDVYHGGSRRRTHPAHETLHQATRREHTRADEEENEGPERGERGEDDGTDDNDDSDDDSDDHDDKETSETSREQEVDDDGSVQTGPAASAGDHGGRSSGTMTRCCL